MSVLYWAVLLNSDSKAGVLDLFPPKHGCIYGEHITLVFGPTTEQNKFFIDKLGFEVEVNTIAYAEDDYGQAVAVDCPLSYNSIPHITISCATGVKPYYSNSILNKAVKCDSLKIVGKVSYFSKSGRWVSA